MLKIGDQAPAFSLQDDSGEKVQLKDFKGKTIVLYFYPKDMTPGCTQEACDFKSAHSKFRRKNSVILGVSKDSIEKHTQFRDKYGLPFKLLSDADGKACHAYGVWQEKSLYGRKFMGIVRSTFVIGPNGKIKQVFSKVKVTQHVDKVLKEI
ncbi:MAG: thioredoxin-dependent thiol peroxidase [Bdellovibrionota bacterium]